MHSSSFLFLCDPQALPDQSEIYSNLSSTSLLSESLASSDGIFTRYLIHFILLLPACRGLSSSWTLTRSWITDLLTLSPTVRPCILPRKLDVAAHVGSLVPSVATTADGQNKGSCLRAFLCGWALPLPSPPTSISQSIPLSLLSKIPRHLNWGVSESGQKAKGNFLFFFSFG